MPLVLVSSTRFADHITPPGHPERPERAHVLDAVAIEWRKGGGAVLAPRAASRAELEMVHAPDYIDEIAASAGRASMLDPDTFTSPDSYEIARLAAGATLVGVDHALGGHGPALALVRPPGHHAERSTAMGFCLFNNVAVAAAYARARGLARVAVVDIDVHHGNGTQWMFYADPAVVYLSTHQFPFYPGTGAATEVGEGSGEGRTVNIPLEAGATDEDYALVYTEVVLPVLAEFRPELILVSAGFDAHDRDPLAQMRVSTAGYAAVVRLLWAAAREHAGGRLVAVTEGGYDLRALGECLEATIAVLSDGARPEPRTASPHDAPRGSRGARAAKAALARYWKCL
jgi:acetoin utilization deacetylase AcuC-like enzyme